MSKRKGAVLAVGSIVILIIVIAIATGGHSAKTPAAAPTPGHSGYMTGSAPPSTAPAAPPYTASQRQAIDAAEGYLSDGQGFSEAGLISQLSSSSGNGFPAADATFAVNHIAVNWRHQAAIAAKGYMSDGQGFSCSGLIQQLTSSYGNQFTETQAEYGARSVGLHC